MSEAKSSKKKEAKAKADPAPKAESKSADAAPKAKESTASADKTSPESGKDAGKESAKDGASESAKEAGKSARESAGGKSDVHYGYFSSVRTPAYRSGWDEIWGSDNGDDAANGDETPRQRRQAVRARGAAKPRKRREPITVTLDLDDLPPDLKDGLVEIASARLKKSRVSYARRDKAGAIDWRITCRVD
ncbi:MAG: hypothetical protein OXI57_10130 [Rhodospirillales bacterium]|nr:hypothetical protein [Rhodospirillales bacterium]